MRVLLVANPASGSGRGARTLVAAERSLRARGATVESFATLAPGDARLRTRAASEGFDRVVACGGDGLVSEVAGALAGGDTPLAIIPAGRGNDLARALGIPLGTDTACGLALTGSPRRLDLGVANGKLFCTVAACGLDAEVSRGARTSRLPLPGAGVYLVEILRQLRRMPHARCRVVADGAVLEDDLMVLAIANTPTYGGGFLIAPGARPDDGLLDLCAITMRSRARALALIASVPSGRHAGQPGVTMLRARRFEVVAEPPLAIEADGEALDTTPVVFEARPAALGVIAP